jgi:hypothetical protein
MKCQTIYTRSEVYGDASVVQMETKQKENTTV